MTSHKPASASKPVALVTGSSRGIGRSIAEHFGRNGFATIVNYFRSPDAAETVVSQIQTAGGTAIAVQGDVGSEEGRENLVRSAMENFGRIDVLINNAGITSQGRKDLLEATEQSWDLVFDTNLKGPFFLAQRAARAMIQQSPEATTRRGTIINISSISAYAATTNRADYCMAKAAMQMMTWLLADRLAEEDIRVYEICPGVIASDMTAPVQEKYDKLIAEGLTPIRRWGETDDIAKVALALTSNLFEFSTGERFNIDGGFHIRRL